MRCGMYYTSCMGIMHGQPLEMERQRGPKAQRPREHIIEMLQTMRDEPPKRHMLCVTYVWNLGHAMDL